MKPGGRLPRITSAFRIRRFLLAYLLAWLWLAAVFSLAITGELFASSWIVSFTAAVCLGYLTVFGIPAYCLLLLAGRRTMPWYCLAGLLAALPPAAFNWYMRSHGWTVLHLMAGLEASLIAYFVIEPRLRPARSDRSAEPDGARLRGTDREAPGWRLDSLLWLAAPIFGAAIVQAILVHFPGPQGEQSVTCVAQFDVSQARELDVSQAREAERVVEDVASRWGLVVETRDFAGRSGIGNPDRFFGVNLYYDWGWYSRKSLILKSGNRHPRWESSVMQIDYWFYPASVEGVPDVDVPRLAWEVMRALEQRLGLSFRLASGPRFAKAEDKWRYCSTHSPGPPLP